MDNIFVACGDDTPPVPGADGPRKYWAAIDPVIADTLKTMDSRDTWTLEDEPEIRSLLDRVIEKMAQSPALISYSLNEPAKAMRVMAWLRSSSALMVLHYSDEDRREVIDRFLEACAATLEAHSEDQELVSAATLAIDRFLVFERLAMLKRLFSEERANLLSNAIRDARQLSEK